MTTSLESLDKASKQKLEDLFKQGTAPALSDLAEAEFHGLNHPRWARALGIRKFIKGFSWKGQSLYGYNRPVKQNADMEAWLTKGPAFGHFLVTPVSVQEKDNAYPHALLLNYGKGGNKRLDPTRNLRDYLVQVDSDNKDLYLGKAYYALGPLRVATNFFFLKRASLPNC